MKFVWSNLWPGLFRDNNNNDDTRRTIYVYIGSLVAFMPIEPNTSQGKWILFENNYLYECSSWISRENTNNLLQIDLTSAYISLKTIFAVFSELLSVALLRAETNWLVIPTSNEENTGLWSLV